LGNLKHLKAYIVIIIALFISFTSRAQSKYKPEHQLNYQKVDEKFLHFGFTLGINQMDFAVYNSGNTEARSEQVKFSNGFTVGIISEIRINNDFSFRFLPGLEFGERIISYKELEYEQTKIESVLINFPFLLKYKAKRINNYRPYIIGGLAYKIDVQAQKRLDIDKEILVRMKSSDVYIELGTGLDFYLPYFKLGVELKFAFGLFDVLNHDLDKKNPGYEEYTNAIEKVNSKIFSLCLNFE
jgi:hypothetical protein